MKRPKFVCLLVMSAALFTNFAAAQSTTNLIQVTSKPIARTVELPGEFLPFLSVEVHARVPGYVERISVDRGSVVKRGDVLIEVTAPEMSAHLSEARSKRQAAEADRAQAEAELTAAQSTLDRTRKAAETPGAIAGNELVQMGKQVEAAKALLHSREEAVRAAAATVHSFEDMLSYLKITAPFDGVVTSRLIHPGALVGPGADSPLLIIQQIAHLRLVVAVPEQDVGAIASRARVQFKVLAYPDRTFFGTIARQAHALDEKTRTMSVELDVLNRAQLLSPGMYASVQWPVRSSRAALFVPKTSVVTTTERTFVIRVQDGKVHWVDVQKGNAEGDLGEVTGDLHAGDTIVRRATDEIREGTPAPK